MLLERFETGDIPTDFFGGSGQTTGNFHEGKGRANRSSDLVARVEADFTDRVNLSVEGDFVDVLTRSLALISPLRVPRARDLPRAHMRSGAPAF